MTDHSTDPGNAKTDAELIAIARKAFHGHEPDGTVSDVFAGAFVVAMKALAGHLGSINNADEFISRHYAQIVQMADEIEVMPEPVPSTPIPDAVLDQAQDAEAALQSFGWPPPLAAYGQALDALAALRQARGK